MSSTPSTPSSGVFLRLALDSLSKAVEAKKVTGLLDAVAAARKAVDANTALTSVELNVVEPLRIAVASRVGSLVVVGMDAIAKLFGHGLVTDKDLVSLCVDVICEAALAPASDVASDDKLHLQIVKALSSAVLASSISDYQNRTKEVKVLHRPFIRDALLLRSIRTTFNIFLLAKSPATQIVAQASLTQMIQAVCGRVPDGFAPNGRADVDAPSTLSPNNSDEPDIACTATDLHDDGVNGSHDVEGSGLQAVDAIPAVCGELSPENEGPTEHAVDPEYVATFDMNIKDVYLVMRALCKLGMKPIPSTEGSTDLKSHAMRSKLLSLHLIHTIMCSHNHIFFINTPGLFVRSNNGEVGTSESTEMLNNDSNEPATPGSPHPSSLMPDPPPAGSNSTGHVDIYTPTLFVHAIKPYLCLCVTRNAVSVVPQVFDVSMEIFGKMLVDLRIFLKREISVIFTEIVLPILESKSTLVTFHQRTTLLKILTTLLSSPPIHRGGRLLVEIYLNYDCDPEATTTQGNLWERLLTLLSRVVTQHPTSAGSSSPSPSPGGTGLNAAMDRASIQANKGSPLRPMTTQALGAFTKDQLRELYSTSGDYGEQKRRGVEAIVRGVLAPLVAWGWERWVVGSGEGVAGAGAGIQGSADGLSEEVGASVDGSVMSLGILADTASVMVSTSGSVPVLNSDDPQQFEALRVRKQNLLEGIKAFNVKPKKGIQVLLENKSIASRTPVDIAVFLLNTEGLDKSMIGDFLGENAEENVAIMHAFVDQHHFTNVPFVTALRNFLQAFRLPGEAQKIDRYMLKFAERYVMQNPGRFSSADTAYVLAYSVIMLNTDQHSAQVKKRMTTADFLKNNRGIDGDQDLPVDFMEAIYDEIKSNEIVLKDEQPVTKGADDLPANVRFAKASENRALKTEERLKASNQRRANSTNPSSSGSSQEDEIFFNHPGNSGVFYTASHYEHLKSMFEVVWMGIFTALSAYLQEAEDTDSIALVLEGFRHSITLACMFDMELERKAFMSTLCKFAQIGGRVGEVKPKNLESVKVLLEVTKALGARLGDGWMDVVLVISNLEKLQSPDGSERSSLEKRRESVAGNKKYTEEAVALATSQSMALLVDKIFTSSVRLSGPAIVGFVRALCSVSWDEITSSESAEHPRMYCLQRLVEISYYNMSRIRVEWSQLWALLGPHFNQVATHKNSQVSFFALDKLRQLAMKFLELEELPNFKFQREFLRPFEYVMGNSKDPKMKEMALMCMQQLIQGKSKAIKSGWKSLFGALMKASKDENEQVVVLAFDVCKMVNKSHFDSLVLNGAFPDFISCLVSFSQNRNFTKTSLQAVELLKQSVPTITASKAAMAVGKQEAFLRPETRGMNASTSSAQLPEDSPTKMAASADDPNFRFLFPILFGFYEVTMTCDLEVRARGLGYLFDYLKMHGTEFSRDSWEVIAKGVLFPIFDDLKLSRQDHRQIDEREDVTVWLSTTLVQALRLLVELFTVQFELLSFGVEGMLEILMACMSQENETLARIGSTCLHQFIENNLDKFDELLWDRICKSFVKLFANTSPNQLFFDYSAQIPDAPLGVIAPPEEEEAEDSQEATATDTNQDVGSEPMARHIPLGASTSSIIQFSDELLFLDGVPLLAGRTKPDKSEFQGIILKCVLHLLVVQTLHEILTTSVSKSAASMATSGDDERIYRAMSVKHLLVLAGCFERSYRFAEAFNKDTELRLALFKMGFMKQLPNLLKQEVASISAYISILFKMIVDDQGDRLESRTEIAGKLIPLCHQVLYNFNTMEPGIKNRNVVAWKPVIILILSALAEMDDALFQHNLPELYEEAMSILLQPTLDLDVRVALHAFAIRVGFACGAIRDPVVKATANGVVPNGVDGTMVVPSP
ncbi:hypothetical protein BC830DRAFT_1239777 [Chytriomyces sp. MP71]|nr:hypothetical protein BC830DRAFT_1239777 [Chytriomyces sp. MP71]